MVHVMAGTARTARRGLLHAFVDAHSGRLLNSMMRSGPPAPKFTGRGIHSGTVTLDVNRTAPNTKLTDTLRGNGQTVDASAGNTLFTSTTNMWGDGTGPTSRARRWMRTGAAMTWDYYKTTARPAMALATTAKPAQTRVHYGTNYNNAFWSDSCFCADVQRWRRQTAGAAVGAGCLAGHEMSHRGDFPHREARILRRVRRSQ